MRTVSPAQLRQFLGGMKTPRVRLWNDRGIFGPPPGKGKARRYDAEDVILARCLQLVMDLTHSRELRAGQTEDIRGNRGA